MMIHLNSMPAEANKFRTMLRVATALGLTLTLLLILMNSSGCVTKIVVIPADQTEVFVKAGSTNAVDGVFMTKARYMRYRQAVADAILKEQTTNE